MAEANFNPLDRVKMRQSHEAAPPPAPPKEFDTTTPVKVDVRRFSLNDLPRYADKLYPVLKEIFPHLHQGMYGGWLRSCITDNASFFIVGKATVAMAKMINDPLDPRPVVQLVFCFGDLAEFKGMYEEMLRWAKDVGAREARLQSENVREVAKLLNHKPTEMRTIAVFHLDG